jgi:hypothetical protein
MMMSGHNLADTPPAWHGRKASYSHQSAVDESGAGQIMAAFSSFDAWAAIFVILIVILLIKGDFRMRAFLLTAGIVVAINDGVVAHALKRICRSAATASGPR